MLRYLSILAVLLGISLYATGAPLRITQSTRDDFGAVWKPGGSTVAYVKVDAAGKWQIGAVGSDGSNERTLATGPGSGYYGLAFYLSWVGAGDLLMTHERYIYHEFISFNTAYPTQPFNRTVSDGSDAAFTRELLVPGGMGGGIIKVSRDGGTVMWKHRDNPSSPSSPTEIRTAPFSSLTGHNPNDDSIPGSSLAYTGHVSTGDRGGAISADGTKILLAAPSGALGGWDLFLYHADGGGLIQQLTTTGQDSGLDNYNPEISPDGGTVIFQRGIEGHADKFDLFTINIDGGGLTQLTNTPGVDEAGPGWAPDGQHYTFQRYDADGGTPNWNVYVDVVPEPASLSLLLGGVLMLRRRKKSCLRP